MNRPKLTANNESVNYCKGCATHTAEAIEETKKQVTTLCGICGKIKERSNPHDSEAIRILHG